MNYITSCIVGTLVACSSLLQNTSGNYNELVANATEFLLKREIITNRCITQNDTIFVGVKNQGEFVANYYYFNKSLVISDKFNVCSPEKSRNRCLQIFVDSIMVNKLDFEYTCASRVNGYLKVNKNNEIEDVRYVKRSH